MRSTKTASILLVLATLVVSCNENEDGSMEKRVPVNIFEATVPTTGTVNQILEIQLKAQATNGCYSKLEIELTENDSRHFLFKATGLFQTHGVCAAVIVYKDTIITYRPPSTGEYYFQINEEPFDVQYDTLVIN